MAALDAAIISALTECLKKYLSAHGQTDNPIFVNAGGSAAVFRVDTPSGARAFKVFDPRFFEVDSGAAERRRLRLQEKLIGHSCPYLVHVYSVTEAEGTAIIEMEFCDWRQLSGCLSQVPDAAVPTLISQLVEVVRYLEALNIVHRDIKPENIHISQDFTTLKVLDLGVVRMFDASDSTDGEVTDHHHLRPFLATAQYSSPEYLFRLDEPTPRLWKALNFYQVGAVLHDLIMKSALFQDEVGRGNRWLVACAVLTKTPSFVDTNPNRLPDLKALATKCLVKDMETRLQIVRWSDFTLDSCHEPLAQLRGRLERRDPGSLDSSVIALESRLQFDRNTFEKKFIDHVRLELIATCGKNLPFNVIPPTLESPSTFVFEFFYSPRCKIQSTVHVEWLQEMYERTAEIRLGDNKVCVVTISEAEDQAVYSVCSALADVVNHGLDLIEGNGFADTVGVYSLQSKLGQVEVN